MATRQGDRHKGCEGDVEVLAHGVRVTVPQPKAKRRFRDDIRTALSSGT